MMENLGRNMVIIGGSAGAYDMIIHILEVLPVDFHPPIVIVLHRSSKFSTQIESNLAKKLNLNIGTAKDKEQIEHNHVYFACPGYHLLIEPDYSFSLDASEPVEFSRPAIDVSFESAADVYGPDLRLFILSGANTDGANGMKYAASKGAHCHVLNPQEALIPTMPNAASERCPEAKPLTKKQIMDYFYHINNN